MISILRTTTPDLLDSSKRQLRAKDYCKDSVLTALLDMQHSKCCYCEKRLTDLGSTERWVEHIKPQDDFKDRNGNIDYNKVNTWKNLLYSCATCNRKKGTTPLIKPGTNKYLLVEPSHPNINPEEHIMFFIDGALIFHKPVPGSEIGKTTIDKLFVKRAELYKAFKKIKSEIDGTFEEIAGAIASNDKGELSNLVNQLTAITCSKHIHAGFIRAFLKHRITLFNTKELPQINNHFGTSFEELTCRIALGHECLT